MKRGPSTTTPTKAEAAYIEAVKSGPCVCCVLWAMKKNGWPLELAVDCANVGVDFHHLLAGGRRRGHEHGVGLCEWHHRGVSVELIALAIMRKLHGPALSEGSRPFHLAFGSDDDLVAVQKQILDLNGGYENVM